MGIGDLVKYGDWYIPSKRGVGLIVQEDPSVTGDKFFLVVWEDTQEWEDEAELAVVSESR